MEYKRLHPPRENRSTWIEPAFDKVEAILLGNGESRRRASCDFGGRTFSEIVRLGREELLVAAQRWTSAYRDVSTGTGERLILSGHQPALVHPGVWFKSFVLDAVARSCDATAVHLVIDNDVLSEPCLDVPKASGEGMETASLAFDRTSWPMPFEERRIEDRALFETFGARVMDCLASMVPNPLMARYWPMVLERARTTDNIGACFAQARHQIEAAWGLQTLEVPQSVVCSGEAFSWFLVHLLQRSTEFREIYNQAIREYRREHRIRSLAHPAPELAVDEGWTETPFWVWTADDPRRCRLFTRPLKQEIVLSDRRQWEMRLPCREDGDASRAVACLMDMQRGGVRIRSRALTTTLWARLVLADLFIHGIGGAKYEAVVDRLIERFFHCPSPGFMVASATLQLPLEKQGAEVEEVRGIQQQLRELAFHPESGEGVKHLPVKLVEEKQRWVAMPQTSDNAKTRCQAIRRANVAMQACLAERREQLLSRLEAARRNETTAEALRRRDYAFCLYPEEELREFLKAALPGASGY